MKLPILILCLIATNSAIYAQLPQIKTIKNGEIHTYAYQKGGDSLTYTILEKKDTVQKTAYYRNGKISTMIWKQDSIYSYDILGRLRSKRYDLENFAYLKENQVCYYTNGQVSLIETYKNQRRESKKFTEDGHLGYAFESELDFSGYYETARDRNNIQMASRRVDTVISGKNLS
jgi:hypothetical protein